MALSRPLPKELLKKMFLKVLNEHFRKGGAYSGWSHHTEGIVREQIANFLKIERLSEQEYANGLRAVYELERDGYIMQDPSQSSPSFKILTDRGKQYISEPLENMDLSSTDIDQLLSRKDLRDKVRDDYLSGDYETAIFKSFKLLEETVRAKSSQSDEVIGADLMSKAFRPGTGILINPNAKNPAEEEALHHLMRGAIMWFKNPTSHRTVGFDKAEPAARILGYANLLLDMVDECKRR